MSAVTPLPAGQPAPPAPSVPTPAPRSPFLYLVTDPWIVISWVLLIGTGMIALLFLMLRSRPPSMFEVITAFLTTGYGFWSTYFGLAACWRLTIRMVRGTSMLIAIVLSMLPPGWILFVFAILYAWFGGGIYQFARRWWLLVHGQQPPFLTAPRRARYY